MVKIGGKYQEKCTENTITAAMLGDSAAVEALVEAYYTDIYAFCCRRVGDVQLGADLTQDTFLKMVRALPGYRHKARFKSWLFTIAANCCRDAHRARRITQPLDEALPDEGAGAFVHQSENAVLLQGAIAALPGPQRECVLLKYYHDFTPQEIAAVQRVPPATVKTRLYRATKRLRAILGEEVTLES